MLDKSLIDDTTHVFETSFGSVPCPCCQLHLGRYRFIRYISDETFGTKRVWQCYECEREFVVTAYLIDGQYRYSIETNEST